MIGEAVCDGVLGPPEIAAQVRFVLRFAWRDFCLAEMFLFLCVYMHRCSYVCKYIREHAYISVCTCSLRPAKNLEYCSPGSTYLGGFGQNLGKCL